MEITISIKLEAELIFVIWQMDNWQPVKEDIRAWTPAAIAGRQHLKKEMNFQLNSKLQLTEGGGTDS